MEFGMSRISLKEVWRNLDDPPKNKEFEELGSDFDPPTPLRLYSIYVTPNEFRGKRLEIMR